MVNALPPALKREVRRQTSALQQDISAQETQRKDEYRRRMEEGNRQAAVAIDKEHKQQLARMRTMDLLNQREVQGAAREEAYREALKDPKMRQQALARQRVDIDDAALSRGHEIAAESARLMGEDPKLSLLAAARTVGRRYAHAAPEPEDTLTALLKRDKERMRRIGLESPATKFFRALRRGMPAGQAQQIAEQQQLAQDRAQWIKDAAALEMTRDPRLSQHEALQRATLGLMKRGPKDWLHGASA